MSRLTIVVNGQSHTVQATPDTPLLYVLRNELGLNGPQFGCGLEQCGACMVLLGVAGASLSPAHRRPSSGGADADHDGALGVQARPACRLPVSEVGQTPITTLEGLGDNGQLHPVQQAFIQTQAAQCGFCSNGMMIEAAALLQHNPHPTDEQIRAALERNLCRCGAHLRILRAVKLAAELGA